MLTTQAVPQSNRELWWSFSAILLVTLVYLFVTITWSNVPAASGLFGHSIGILGFLLMLMTEILYSLRKRSRSTRWGPISSWLRFHIFTGLVGPYMVLLHTSWKFNGLAGITMLMTVIVVASGFIGRYIYTSIPRTVDGAEVEAGVLAAQIAAIEAQLERWEKGSSSDSTRPRPGQLERIKKRRQTLRRQSASLATARRVMALWHAIHIPIGMALFTAAFIHMAAAIYYATLLR